MSFLKSDRLFPIEPDLSNERHVADFIAQALRHEYEEVHSAVKVIGRQTGAHPRAIRNWYDGVNAPNCTHLITLARHTPVILETFLGLTGHKTIWEFYRKHGSGHDYSMTVRKTNSKQAVYGDKSVTINVAVNVKDAVDLNQRQLWFLGCIQGGKKPRTEAITEIWDVTLRTAKRDVAGLVKKKLIRFSGAKKTGLYELENSFFQQQ